MDSSKLGWVDFMRVLAAFLVVLAHVCDWGHEPWLWGAFYYTLSRVAVPFFFLTGGFLLLSKEEDLWTFLRKRLAKIAVPFIVWSVLYDIQNSHPFAESGVTGESIAGMVVRILSVPREAHLWFFYSLIGLYLITPMLRVFVANAKESDLLYFIALWFLVKPVLMIVEEFTPVKIGFDLFYVSGYLGCFLLGYYLGRMELTPRLLRFSVFVFILGFLATFAVFYLDLPPVDNEAVLRDYPSLNIVLMSLGAFVLIKHAAGRTPDSWIQLSSKASPVIFGIYLIHPMLLRWMALGMESLGYDPYAGYSLLMIPIIALMAFLISWLIVYLTLRVPLLRSIF